MGFSMIEVIRNVRMEINFNELDMRIGIHTVIYYLIYKIRVILSEELRGQI